MDSDIREALVLMQQKIESIGEKIDMIADEVNEIKEYLPDSLDEDLTEIKSLMMQVTLPDD